MKRVFFTVVYVLLNVISLRNRKYYYSKWVANNGDNTLLIKYRINSRSTVIDIGGYTGSFSDQILSLYNPRLIIFEPVKKYYKILKNKYANNKNVKVYNYGLSNKNHTQNIYLSKDGTSLVKKSGKSEKVKLVDASHVFKKIGYVDLVSINIEGAEYDVLERLINTGATKKIKFIQVQFHPFVLDAAKRRSSIINNIRRTHKINFSYPFVWESFELKN